MFVAGSSRGHEREPTRHYADGWHYLPAEGDSPDGESWLGWASTPGADGDATRPWLRTSEKASTRATWFMVPVALG